MSTTNEGRRTHGKRAGQGQGTKRKVEKNKMVMVEQREEEEDGGDGGDGGEG